MKSAKIKSTVLICLLLCSIAQAGDVHKWIGPDGRVSFGDKPPPGFESEQLHIRTFNGTPDVKAADTSVGANVVMFSTTWCGVCKRAKEYFNAKGIAFTEYDVEKSDTGRTEYKRLNGRGVPIILVGDRRMDGFSAQQFEQMRQPAGQ